MLRNLTLAACLCLVASSCSLQPGRTASASPTPEPTAGAAASQPASPSPSAAPAPAVHIFVIVLENRSYAQAIAAPYISSLANHYGVAANYHGVSHPSLPNYLAMTSGSTWGIADDGYHPLPATGLGAQLNTAGIPWRAYMEGLNATCFSSGYPYALKHDPFPYYGNACPSQVVPFSQFNSDAKADKMPQFTWISPGLCNDGHDCPTSVTDGWLSQVVPEIQATTAWKQNGLLVITWDEGEDSANHVLTLVIRPGAHAAVTNRYYDHYSLLATIEDRFGVPRLGQAAGATPLTDLLFTGTVTLP